MTTKAVSLPTDEPSDFAKDATGMLLIALPLETYSVISNAAAKRNMTFAAALSAAITAWLDTPAKPQLLVERSGDSK